MADTTNNVPYDPTKEINALKDSRLKAEQSALEARRQATINSLNAQQSKIQPKVDENKNSSSIASQLNARNFAEYMAQRGNNNPAGQSGTMNQANISRGVALQGAYSAADKWGRDQFAEYERQKSEANTASNNELSTIQSKIESDAMQSLINAKIQQEQNRINQMNADRSFNEGVRQFNVGQVNSDRAYNEGVRQFDVGQGNFDKTFNQNQSNSDRTFNEGIRQFNVGQGNWDKIFNQTQNNADRTFKLQEDSEKLNRMNTLAGLTGQIPASELISQMSSSQIEAYKNLANQNGGFAAAINSTNDPVQKAIINEFRNQYLQQNPNNPYANTQTNNVMVPTMQGRQLESGLQTEAMQRVGLEISNKINQIKLDNLPEETALMLKTAKIQADKGQADLAYQLIVNSNAPEKFKAEIAQTYQQVAASKASVDQAWKQLDISQQKANNKSSNSEFKKTPYYSDTYNAIADQITKWEEDPNVVVPNKKPNEKGTEWINDGTVLKDYIRTPGSKEYNQIVSKIMGDPTLNSYEKYKMLDDFRIPYQ